MTFGQLRTFPGGGADGLGARPRRRAGRDRARRFGGGRRPRSASWARALSPVRAAASCLTAAGRDAGGYAAELVGLATGPAPSRRPVAAATGRGHHRRRVRPARADQAFRQAHPAVDVALEVGNRAGCSSALLRREVDLAVGGRPAGRLGIAGVPFLDYRLVVVAAADHAVRDPADETWLLRERGSGTRETVERYVSDAGIRPRATMTVGRTARSSRPLQSGWA